MSYGPEVNVSELHFWCFFRGYPTWPYGHIWSYFASGFLLHQNVWKVKINYLFIVKCGIVLSAVKVVDWLETFELFQMKVKVELWILSGVLESFLSLQLTVKVKGCIFFCLQKIISEVKEKCEIKLWRAWASDPSHSCRWSPWPSLEVGLDLIVLLVQMTTMVFWRLLNLFFAQRLLTWSSKNKLFERSKYIFN